MSIEELIQMILGERINSALQETSLERDKDILEKGEAVLKKLPEEQREIIQNYLNSFLNQASEDNERAYLCGFEDALCLVERLGTILVQRSNQ